MLCRATTWARSSSPACCADARPSRRVARSCPASCASRYGELRASARRVTPAHPWHHRGVSAPRDPVADLRGSPSCSSAPTSRPTGCGPFAGPPPRSAACPGRAGGSRRIRRATAPARGRRRDRAVRRRVARRRGAGLPAPSAGHRGHGARRRRRRPAGGAARRLPRHTDASDGGSPTPEMVETARDLGHEYLVITDHSPRLTVANGLSPERLRAQLRDVAELNEAAGRHRRSGC